jgi:hypothetical protein
MLFLADSFHPEDRCETFLRNVGSNKTHCAISKEMAFFIVTAVKTPNLTIQCGVVVAEA